MFSPETTTAVGAFVAARHWVARARKKLALRDAVQLLTPWFAGRLAWWALGRHTHEAAADDPAARDPELVVLVADLMRAIGKHYFRLEIRGVENVPPAGAALLVGNHNGGLEPLDTMFTMVAVLDRLGPERALYMLAHDFVFDDRKMQPYAVALGAMRAGHRGAHRAFERGALVLVYPGSDLDTFRPWRQRHKIVLGGRKGFLELALRERVPIVPVVSVGTHEQFIVLTRGDRLARLLPMHRLGRTDVMPIVLSFPWGVTSGFLPYLPLPAQTTIAFGPPLSWPELGLEAADDPMALEGCYRAVEARMQGMLDDLAVSRRPWLGAKR